MRRRANIESHMPFDEAVAIALRWAGDGATIHVPDTASVEENSWLENLGIPISCASPRSRFHSSAHGHVIGAFLNLSEVPEVERSRGVEGIVVVQAHGPMRYVENVPSHAPWITAFGAEHLGGNEIPPTPGLSAPLKLP
jgi:hypothetical protein